MDPRTTSTDVLHLGPADDGRELSEEAFDRADWEPGWKYELVAGRLAVSPKPECPDWSVEEAILDLLKDYAKVRRDVIRTATTNARVLTRQPGGPTNVEPDITVYRKRPRRGMTWREAQPILVVEVVTASHPEKDYIRNRDVYALVASIREYWIVDPRDDPARPHMLALVRRDAGWIERPVPPGGTYVTDLLPGFSLDLSTLDDGED